MAWGPGMKGSGWSSVRSSFLRAAAQQPGMACGGFLPPSGTSSLCCSLPEPPAAEAAVMQLLSIFSSQMKSPEHRLLDQLGQLPGPQVVVQSDPGFATLRALHQIAVSYPFPDMK